MFGTSTWAAQTAWWRHHNGLNPSRLTQTTQTTQTRQTGGTTPPLQASEQQLSPKEVLPNGLAQQCPGCYVKDTLRMHKLVAIGKNNQAEMKEMRQELNRLREEIKSLKLFLTNFVEQRGHSVDQNQKVPHPGLTASFLEKPPPASLAPTGAASIRFEESYEDYFALSKS